MAVVAILVLCGKSIAESLTLAEAHPGTHAREFRERAGFWQALEARRPFASADTAAEGKNKQKEGPEQQQQQ
jgi:hypothetical protein